MPLPEGYVAKPARREDAEAITALFVEHELTFNQDPESTVEDLYDDWSAPETDMEKDTFTVWDGDLLVAYTAVARVTPPDIYSAYGEVRPSHWGRRIGAFLVDVIEERVSEKAGGPALVRQWVDASAAPAIALLESRGYSFIRRFWRMSRSLEQDLESPRPVEGVTIRPFAKDEDDEAAHDALEAAFQQLWGHTPRSYEETKESRWKAEWFRADLSLIAESDGAIVGVCINGQRFGDGYVEDLGVIPEWRGRGIAEALLRTSLVLFTDLGMQKAGLNVDSDNTTGATRLYERVGFANAYSYNAYEKRLGG